MCCQTGRPSEKTPRVAATVVFVGLLFIAPVRDLALNALNLILFALVLYGIVLIGLSEREGEVLRKLAAVFRTVRSRRRFSYRRKRSRTTSRASSPKPA